MTAPIWMAAPPEVHSALLSSGPGPGPLLASAAAWSSLSIEYAEAAVDLSALVAGVQAGAWEGPSAESYVAANAPYVAWLGQAATNAWAWATQQEIAAAAYTAALAAMPSLGELAANHATNAALLATNFFGINTIPIALNEADYVRMWIQAATTMSVYQGVSTTALTASPQPTAAPAIVKTPAASSTSSPSLSDFLNQLGTVLNSFGASGHDETLISYLLDVPAGTNPFSLIGNDIATDSVGYPAVLQALLGAAGDNPVYIALAYLVGGFTIIYDLTTQILQFLVTFPLLFVGLAPGLLAFPAVAAGLAGFAAGGIVGVAEIAAHLPTGVESIPAAPITPGSSPAPSPASGSAAPAAGHAAPLSAPGPGAPAPASASGVPSAPGSPPPPSATAGPYLVSASTTVESRTSAKASARSKAAAPDIAAAPAAAAASARDKARERRRRRAEAEMLGRGYAYMDLDDDPEDLADDAPTATSHRSPATLGFAGTARQEDVAGAAGLTTLAGDAFGGGPKEPMMPGTWAPDGSI